MLIEERIVDKLLQSSTTIKLFATIAGSGYPTRGPGGTRVDLEATIFGKKAGVQIQTKLLVAAQIPP